MCTKCKISIILPAKVDCTGLCFHHIKCRIKWSKSFFFLPEQAHTVYIVYSVDIYICRGRFYRKAHRILTQTLIWRGKNLSELLLLYPQYGVNNFSIWCTSENCLPKCRIWAKYITTHLWNSQWTGQVFLSSHQRMLMFIFDLVLAHACVCFYPVLHQRPEDCRAHLLFLFRLRIPQVDPTGHLESCNTK